MTKRPQGPDALRQHLQEQVGFLRKSGAAFNDGDVAEAKRLAATIRTLVHDTATSHSLLSQLHAKEKLRFEDSSHPPLTTPGAIRIDAGLAVIHASLGLDTPTEYAAPLGDAHRGRGPRRFGPWWTEPVLTDQRGTGFNRKTLVLGLANKEGGSHVDPELEENYAPLTLDNSLGWGFSSADGTEWIDAGSPVPANVRQTAWEVQITIERHFRALFPAGEKEQG